MPERPEGGFAQIGTVSFSRPKLVVASIQSLVQPVPSRETLHRQTRTLHVGQAVALAELTSWLAENGLASTPAVELPGEFSIRGGIVDVFAPDWDGPVRIEFFGDEIESIRRFEISSQRSLQSLASVDVTIVGAGLADRAHLADYLPPQSWFLLLDPLELEHEGRQYLERGEGREERGEGKRSGQWPVASGQKADAVNLQISRYQIPNPPSLIPNPPLHTVSDVLKQVFRFPSVTASAVATASMETTCRLKIESVERFSGDINRVRDELDEAGGGSRGLRRLSDRG